MEIVIVAAELVNTWTREKGNTIMDEAEGPFNLGQKVRVLAEGWPDKPTGTIVKPDASIQYIIPNWTGLFSWSKSTGILHRVYWVDFDTPQSDGSDDGPYGSGAVSEDYLEALS